MEKQLHSETFITKIETDSGRTLYCICEFDPIDMLSKEFKFGTLTLLDGSQLYKGDCNILNSKFKGIFECQSQLGLCILLQNTNSFP